MIYVHVDHLGPAAIEGGRWTAATELLRGLLQDATDTIVLPAAITDADSFLVRELGRHVSLTVLPDPWAQPLPASVAF